MVCAIIAHSGRSVRALRVSTQLNKSPIEVARRDLIDGLGRGLRVLEAFDDEHPRLTPSEVAQLASLTRTAARRYLLSLVHFGYAATDGKHFWLLPRVLRLGQSYLGSARLPRLVQPFIQRASLQCGETVNVSVLGGHEVVYLARSNPPRVVSIGYHPGARVPAHAVAAGVALLSSCDEAALDAWIAAHDFVAFTPHTTTDRALFRQEVVRARQAGHALTDSQLDAGLRGVALPLRDRKGECRGAVSITMQSAAYTPQQVLERLLPLLNEAAQNLRPLL